MPDTHPIRWEPTRAATVSAWPTPTLATAMLRGLRGRCPACGRTALFRGYLRVAETCASCDAPLGQVRADDAPPYFTIFVVGHLIVGLMFAVDRAWAPSVWVHAAIWLPLTVVLSIALLRPIKGATVGLMLRLGLVKDNEP